MLDLNINIWIIFNIKSFEVSGAVISMSWHWKLFYVILYSEYFYYIYWFLVGWFGLVGFPADRSIGLSLIAFWNIFIF